MKKIPPAFIFILILFSLGLFLAPATAGAQKPLEVIYSPLPGIDQVPETTDVELPVYVRYIFTFIIVISGLVALGALIYAGFRYLTSAGNPQKLQDAKDQMLAAGIGLVILLGSWIILYSLNPELIELRIPGVRPNVPPLYAGVYLCLPPQNYREDGELKRWEGDEMEKAWLLIKEIRQLQSSDPENPQIQTKTDELNELLKEIGSWCWHATSQTKEIPKKFNSVRNTRVWTVPTPETRTASSTIHGAILNDKSNFGGRAQVALRPIPDLQVPDLEKFDITAIKPSSVRPFVVEYARPESFLKLYELINFNKADPNASSSTREMRKNRFATFVPPLPPFERVGDGNRVGIRIGSTEIEGNLIVVFFKDFYTQTVEALTSADLDVVLQTNADLHTRAQTLRWCWFRPWRVFYDYFYCSEKIFIIAGGIY